MNATKQQYQLCAKIKKSLIDLHGDQYYTQESKLNTELRYLFKSNELHTLTKKELLHVLSICSTHRPIALHSLLIEFSKAYDTLSGK